MRQTLSGRWANDAERRRKQGGANLQDETAASIQ